MKIDRGTIVEAALALLDEQGFDALSLRRLAARLHVQAPALYWHVRDKEELLTLMVDALLARDSKARLPEPGQHWTDWIIDRGTRLRRILMECRDSARLVITARQERQTTEGFPVLQQALMAQGLDEGEATRVIAVSQSYILGWVHYEQHPPMRDFMASVMELESSYHFGLRAMAEGLRMEIAGRRAARGG